MLEFTLQHPIATAFIFILGFWSIESIVKTLVQLIEFIIFNKRGGDNK